ncbi:MAG: hypothetical protein ACTH27_07955 [Staphylococcus equorum]
MKKLKVLIIFMTVAILTSIVLTSCGKKEEPKIEKISLKEVKDKMNHPKDEFVSVIDNTSSSGNDEYVRYIKKMLRESAKKNERTIYYAEYNAQDSKDSDTYKGETSMLFYSEKGKKPSKMKMVSFDTLDWKDTDSAVEELDELFKYAQKE